VSSWLAEDSIVVTFKGAGSYGRNIWYASLPVDFLGPACHSILPEYTGKQVPVTSGAVGFAYFDHEERDVATKKGRWTAAEYNLIDA
jgi:hypothetical protein